MRKIIWLKCRKKKSVDESSIYLEWGALDESLVKECIRRAHLHMYNPNK